MCKEVPQFFAAVNVNGSHWWHVHLHKMSASLWICIEIDPHSHSACTKLTEIFSPALQNYLENAAVIF